MGQGALLESQQHLVLTGLTSTYIQGIEQFRNLEVLQLKNNNIESVAVLSAIHNKFALKNLNLLNNPVANDPKCTFKYLNTMFVNLRELNETLTCFNQSK